MSFVLCLSLFMALFTALLIAIGGTGIRLCSVFSILAFVISYSVFGHFTNKKDELDHKSAVVWDYHFKQDIQIHVDAMSIYSLCATKGSSVNLECKLTTLDMMVVGFGYSIDRTVLLNKTFDAVAHDLDLI